MLDWFQIGYSLSVKIAILHPCLCVHLSNLSVTIFKFEHYAFINLSFSNCPATQLGIYLLHFYFLSWHRMLFCTVALPVPSWLCSLVCICLYFFFLKLMQRALLYCCGNLLLWQSHHDSWLCSLGAETDLLFGDFFGQHTNCMYIAWNNKGRALYQSV